MNDEEFKPLKLEAFIEGIRGLPDSYDDGRIDNLVDVITEIVKKARSTRWIDLKDIEEIVADSTEFPDMWEDGYDPW